MYLHSTYKSYKYSVENTSKRSEKLKSVKKPSELYKREGDRRKCKVYKSKGRTLFVVYV